MAHEHDEPKPAVKEVPTYEEGVNISAIFKFLIGLLIVGIIVHLLVWGYFGFLRAYETKQDPHLSPLAIGRQYPPEPKLQVSEPTDLQKIRKSEDQMLDGYGWVDQSRGIARIPVNKAMKILVQQKQTKQK